MVSHNKLEVIRKLFYWLTISNFLYIIVIMILAGVSINLLFGQYGIVTRAKDAKALQEEAQVNEQTAISADFFFADEL